MSTTPVGSLKSQSSKRTNRPVSVALDSAAIPPSTSQTSLSTSASLITTPGRRPRTSRKEKEDLLKAEDTIVGALITSDSQTELAPAIKSIFEQRKENEVIQSLSNFVQTREQDIEKICQSNFQGFIRSVDDLFVVRKNIDDLKNSLHSLNRDMQQSVFELLQKAAELDDLRQVSQNINAAIETVTTCQYILGLCAKVKEYVENKKFYPAIKLLDQLQQVHLKAIAEYEFGKYLEKKIPLMKHSIKKRVLGDVTHWLLNIRLKASEIGDFAMAQTEAEIRLKEEMSKRRQKEEIETSHLFSATIAVIMSKRMRTETFLQPKPPAELTPEGGAKKEKGAAAAALLAASAAAQDKSIKDRKVQQEAEKSEEPVSPSKVPIDDITEVSVFEKVSINFAPLYQCSYIYESIGEKEEFQKFYVENRKAQSKLVLQLEPGQNFMKTYKNYLHNVAGFFICEATVLQTSNDLIASYDVMMLWDTALSKVKALLQQATAYCDDVAVLSELKDFLLVFSRTLRKYGYDLSAISEFTKVPLRDRYILVATTNVTNESARLLALPEAYQPYVPPGEFEIKENITAHKFDSLFERGTKTFPFSFTLCKITVLVKKFAKDLMTFSQNLSEMDPVIIKSTEHLLKVILNLLLGKAQEQLRKERQVTQIAQAYVNCFWMEKLVAFYEDYLKLIGIQNAAFNYRPAFLEGLQRLEELVYQCNEVNIDREFDKLTVNLDTKPVAKATAPREYIATIIKDISQGFPKVNTLPRYVYEQMYHRAYKHVARAMMNLIASDKIKVWNLAYIFSLNEDLTLVEDSLKKAPMQGLIDYFGELRQIIDLILSSDILAYMDPNVRAKMYPKISSPKKLLVILEKFREEGFTKLFVSGTKAKQIAALIQKLKTT